MYISYNSLLSESVCFLYQNWRDRRTYSPISSFKEWWGRVDYLVTNIIFVVKDFFRQGWGDENEISPQRRGGRKERSVSGSGVKYALLIYSHL